MIVRPPISDDMSRSEKRLLRSELARAAELAFSADNKEIELLELQRYAIEYNLDQDFEEEGKVPWLDGEKPSPEDLIAQNKEAEINSYIQTAKRFYNASNKDLASNKDPANLPLLSPKKVSGKKNDSYFWVTIHKKRSKDLL